jgi:hypothetical protein
VTVRAPVPIHNGDTISLLGYHGSPFHRSKAAEEALVIDVPAAALQSGSYA